MGGLRACKYCTAEAIWGPVQDNEYVSVGGVQATYLASPRKSLVEIVLAILETCSGNYFEKPAALTRFSQSETTTRHQRKKKQNSVTLIFSYQ